MAVAVFTKRSLILCRVCPGVGESHGFLRLASHNKTRFIQGTHGPGTMDAKCGALFQCRSVGWGGHDGDFWGCPHFQQKERRWGARRHN